MEKLSIIFSFFFLVGLSLAGFLCGMLLHESGHAIACLLLGIPYSFSLTHVTFNESSIPLVNIVVRLAGGITQTLFSFLFLLLIRNYREESSEIKFFREDKSLKLGLFLGFEYAFVAVALHGIINSIWEGFFYEHYEKNYNNPIFVLVITLTFLIAGFMKIKKLSETPSD